MNADSLSLFVTKKFDSFQITIAGIVRGLRNVRHEILELTISLGGSQREIGFDTP